MNNRTDDDMAEKILNRLMSIIVEDDQLKEFSFIPTCDDNADVNVCPVKYARAEHCLALETWCLKHVFKYAQRRVFELTKHPHRRCEEGARALDTCLTGALLILPDATTLWNIRRALFTSGRLHADFEFRLSALVLSTRCKSYEAFAYRRWLLDKGAGAGADWPREAEVLRVATARAANNYHAWNHRIWCFENVLPEALRAEEVMFSEAWIARHVSEHSGFHYRQHVLKACARYPLLPHLGKGSESIVALLDTEHLEDDKRLYGQYLFVLVHELLTVLPVLHLNFPGHETIWYHRRFVLAKIYRTVCEVYGGKPAGVIPDLHLPEDVNITESSVVVCADVQGKSGRVLAAEASALMKMVLDRERAFLEGACANGNRWLGCDSDYVCKYRKWMRCVLGLVSF